MGKIVIFIFDGDATFISSISNWKTWKQHEIIVSFRTVSGNIDINNINNINEDDVLISQFIEFLEGRNRVPADTNQILVYFHSSEVYGPSGSEKEIELTPELKARAQNELGTPNLRLFAYRHPSVAFSSLGEKVYELNAHPFGNVLEAYYAENRKNDGEGYGYLYRDKPAQPEDLLENLMEYGKVKDKIGPGCSGDAAGAGSGSGEESKIYRFESDLKSENVLSALRVLLFRLKILLLSLKAGTGTFTDDELGKLQKLAQAYIGGEDVDVTATIAWQFPLPDGTDPGALSLPVSSCRHIHGICCHLGCLLADERHEKRQKVVEALKKSAAGPLIVDDGKKTCTFDKSKELTPDNLSKTIEVTVEIVNILES